MARFDRISHVYDWLPIPTHASVLRERAQGAPGRRLDLGGGTGRFSVRIHPGPQPPVVLDASQGMLDQGRRAGRNLTGVVGRGEAMPFEDASFGVVTVTEAFHHFAPHQADVVSEVARVLAPDGAFLIEEIDPDRFLGRLVELGEKLLAFGSRFLAPVDLESLLRTRFSTVEIERTGRFTYVAEARGPTVGASKG